MTIKLMTITTFWVGDSYLTMWRKTTKQNDLKDVHKSMN